MKHSKLFGDSFFIYQRIVHISMSVSSFGASFSLSPDYASAKKFEVFFFYFRVEFYFVFLVFIFITLFYDKGCGISSSLNIYVHKILDLLVHERMKLHFYATIYYCMTKDNGCVKDLCAVHS